jgi:HAD superfamily hydrolase (TIGR01509 family)
MFSAFIFDLDGVIADTESVQLHAINLLLHPFGHSLTQEEWAKEYVGHPIEEDVRAIQTRFRLETPLKILSERRRILYKNLLQDGAGLQTLPGLDAFLGALRERHMPLAIASGSPRADVETVLRTLNLRERFNAIAAADEVAHPKPAPDVYLLATRQLKIQAHECLAIEDSATGIASAKSAGLQVAAIPSAYTRHQDLSKADVLLDGFYELSQLLFRRA